MYRLKIGYCIYRVNEISYYKSALSNFSSFIIMGCNDQSILQMKNIITSIEIDSLFKINQFKINEIYFNKENNKYTIYGEEIL